MISGLGASRKLSLVNLRYIDDTLLSGKMDIIQAVITQWILHFFEFWSKMRVNFHKSQLIFLGEIDTSGLIVEWILAAIRTSSLLNTLAFHLDLVDSGEMTGTTLWTD